MVPDSDLGPDLEFLYWGLFWSFFRQVAGSNLEIAPSNFTESDYPLI
jgi:hypothetical protein